MKQSGKMEVCLNVFEWLALVFVMAGIRYKSLLMSTMLFAYLKNIISGSLHLLASSVFHCWWYSMYVTEPVLCNRFVTNRAVRLWMMPSLRICFFYTGSILWYNTPDLSAPSPYFAMSLWLAFSGHNYLLSYQFSISPLIEVPGLQVVSIGENNSLVPPPLSHIKYWVGVLLLVFLQY